MTVLTLSEIKTHLRVDGDADDHLIESLNRAAHDYAEQYLGRGIPWTDEEGELVDPPESIKAAILLVIGDLYENKEGQFVGVSVAENQTVEKLLHFYRVGLGI